MLAPNRRALLLGALLLGLMLGPWMAPARAQAISYTVQVVALSDRDAALAIVSDLLRQGFPGYVVRSTSSQGDVFRVRVGAFANRNAALLYASAMPEVAGGQPVPALAEAIPPGITPLAPRLLLMEEVGGLDVRLLRFGAGVTLRTQRRSPLAPAEYAIVHEGSVERVRAWQLAEASDGSRLRVRDLPLWPESWAEESDEVREGYLNSLLGLVAERLELPLSAVTEASYPNDEGVPRLVVVERVVPGAADGPLMIGLGLPASGMSSSGPLEFLKVEREQLPGLEPGVRVDIVAGRVDGDLGPPPSEEEPEGGSEPAGEPPADEASDSEGASDAGTTGEANDGTDDAPEADRSGEDAPGAEEPEAEVRGDGWIATADGPFIRLTVFADASRPASSWRAGRGLPLWSDGHYLLAASEGQLLLYDFLPR